MGPKRTLSDRYAGWFGSRVPMTSRTMLYLMTIVVSLGTSFFLYNPAWSGPNWMLVLAVSPVVAMFSHLIFLLLQIQFYHNPVENPAFEEVEDRADQKLEVISSAQVWSRPSKHVFITSVSSALYNSVIVSEPMIEKIIQHPEDGEVVLAFHMLRAKDCSYIDLVLTIMVFLIMTAVELLVVWPFVAGIVSMAGYLGILYVLLMMGYLVLPAVILVLVLKSATWRFDNTLNEIWRIYDVHPQVAKTQLEGEKGLAPEGVEAIVWSVKQWERGKRYTRRTSLAAIAAALAFFGFVLFFPPSYVIYGYYNTLLMLFAPPVLVGIVVFIAMKYWDKKCMTEVYVDSKDAHEPIWLGQDLWEIIESQDDEGKQSGLDA
ncbi:MAG: hypothetical protein JSW61_12165 [Candidatus Thorarchaeota archaeon]|nr:MAG: hypothetical protein JSW61_12165 [Candidatus Thorarchaeota archaeon]